MTPAMDERGRLAVEAVRDWVARLQPGLATCEERFTDVEHILRLVPVNPRAAGVVFRVAYYGLTGIHFAKGADFEEVEASPELIRQICDALRDGRVRDTVRSLFGFEVAVTTILDLGGGRQLSDRSINALGLLLVPLIPPRVITYEPWSPTPADVVRAQPTQE